MNTLQAIAEVDRRLFAELAKADAMNEEYLKQQLTVRAKLLQELLLNESLQQDNGKSQIFVTESKELITRSRQLKETAEQLQQQLGEQLKIMGKGRRSVQAYQTVKRNKT